MRAELVLGSYGAGALLFGLLTLLLLTAWRGRLQGGLLVLATAVSTLWCAVIAINAVSSVLPASALQFLEVIRDAAWLLFLLRLLGYAREERAGTGTGSGLTIIAVLLAALCVAVLATVVANKNLASIAAIGSDSTRFAVFGHVLLAVAGLALIEQVYRNTRADFRWAVKFMCFGAGGLFAFDLYLYSKALMFHGMDETLWIARGAINAFVVPMVAVSAARNPQWSLDIFVSRHIVFHSTALLGAGVYLMAMSAAGYYLRAYGGAWGAIAQAVFLFGAVAVLILLMLSGQVRSRLRVFLSKHFYRNQYDYRDEWLRFTRTLASPQAGDDLHETVTRAIAQIIESPGGMMWVKSAEGMFRPAAPGDAWLPPGSIVASDSSLARYLARDGWVLFLDELEADPDEYAELSIPEWFAALRQPWTVVPLMHADSLLAFIVLRRSSTKRSLTWEDRDLLKTVGQQAASHMALWIAREALTEARQFEAFNRLSAYVVHDLKNLVAQLSLVVRNAKRHLHTPGFMEDAVDTVDNAASKMSRMLAQLRKGTMPSSAARTFELNPVLREVVEAQARRKPTPVLNDSLAGLRVTADPDRFAAIVEHIVQNAQDASDDTGSIEMTVRMEDLFAVIEIADTGSGMDETFVAQRLFRPFDTTKGNAGMGVGVYETREFLQALGGRVEVESELGRGSTFSLWVPLSEGQGDRRQSEGMEMAT